MLYLQIESPKSSVLNFLDSNSFEVIISIFQRTEKVPDMERLLPRMLVHQNVPLLCRGDMGVDFCDVDGTVTKHFLDVADIHIGF